MNKNPLQYTGSTSQTFNPTEPTKSVKKKIDERLEKRGKLMPAAELVFGILQAEKDAISSVELMNIEEMLTDEHFKAELMARKKYIEYLDKLQTKLDVILREPKRRKK